MDLIFVWQGSWMWQYVHFITADMCTLKHNIIMYF